MERETIHRHRSERLLDRFLQNSHFDQSETLHRIKPILQRAQQSSESRQKTSEVTEATQRRSDKYESLDEEQILTKIM